MSTLSAENIGWLMRNSRGWRVYNATILVLFLVATIILVPSPGAEAQTRSANDLIEYATQLGVPVQWEYGYVHPKLVDSDVQAGRKLVLGWYNYTRNSLHMVVGVDSPYFRPALAHELGHAIDDLHMQGWQRDLWRQLRGSVGVAWADGVAANDDSFEPTGDFAECFAFYLIGYNINTNGKGGRPWGPCNGATNQFISDLLNGRLTPVVPTPAPGSAPTAPPNGLAPGECREELRGQWVVRVCG